MDDEFHFDDQSGIVENEAVHTLTDIGEMWSKNRSRFLGVLSFALNYRFGKLNVFGYHLVNLCIHIITAFLVYLLLALLLACHLYCTAFCLPGCVFLYPLPGPLPSVCADTGQYFHDVQIKGKMVLYLLPAFRYLCHVC
jgi:hypothetical protein